MDGMNGWTSCLDAATRACVVSCLGAWLRQIVCCTSTTICRRHDTPILLLMMQNGKREMRVITRAPPWRRVTLVELLCFLYGGTCMKRDLRRD